MSEEKKKEGRSWIFYLILFGMICSFLEKGCESSDKKIEKTNQTVAVDTVETEKILTAAEYLSQYKKHIDERNGSAWIYFNKIKEHYPNSEEFKQAEILRLEDIKKTQEELKAAEERKKKDIAQGKKAIKQLNKKYDKVRKITWYESSVLQNSPLDIYIGVGEAGNSWMCYRLRYYSSDWVFWDKFHIYTDGDVRTLAPLEHPKREVVGGGNIIEYADGVFDGSVFGALLEASIMDIVESKDALIRFEGRKHYDDKKITNKMRQAMKNVLDSYKLLQMK